MSFCQDHKRAGMYTSRNGRWLVATNDGNGENLIRDRNSLHSTSESACSLVGSLCEMTAEIDMVLAAPCRGNPDTKLHSHPTMA